MDSHLPLSTRLQQIVEHPSARNGLTLNVLLQQTQGRGFFLLMVLLCLPFVVPVSVPGMSVLMGSAVMLLSLRLALDFPPQLPKRIGEHALPEEKMKAVLVSSVRFLRFLERFVKPRRSAWMSWRVTRTVNALLIAFMAFLLALPLPPIPPFTNTFPSYAIILLALSMMEEDGVIVLAGYAVAMGTVVYFLLMGELILRHLHKVAQALIS